MKNLIILFTVILCTSLGFNSCGDNPIDEDGLLITDNAQCYISMFELLGPDHRTVLVGTPEIDTMNCTIKGVAKFGTNMAHLKPHCSLSLDAKIQPSMGTWTDFGQTLEYTVISGNRQIMKNYKITITLQGE